MNELHMTSAEAPAEMRPRHSYRAFILRAGLSVAIILFLFWRYDARSIFRILAREDPGYFLATVALFIAGHVIAAYRWQLLAAIVGIHGSFMEFVAIYFIGFFTNLFVPGLIAGDAARVVYLGRRHGRMSGALASIAANRAYGLLGLFWLAAAMVYLFKGGGLPVSVTRPILWIGGLSLAVHLASPWLATVIPATPGPVRRAIELIAPYLSHPFKTVLPLVLSIALQASRAVSQWLLALGLGLHVPVRPFLLVVPIASVFASLPVSLAGLGVREAVYLVLFAMVGVDRNDAVVLGLLYFAVTMLAGLTGALAFIAIDLPSRSVIPATDA
jgi:glycosyltransferase 2 family protein